MTALARNIVFALLALLLAADAGASEEKGSRERSFIRALEIFDQAKSPDDYRQAAELFESLNADEFENGAAYYNAGNARMRAGDYGRAIANYRKARLYRPRDSFLDANLRLALSLAPGRLPEAPQPSWKHVLFWSDWLSYPEKFYLPFGVFCIGIVIATIGLMLRNKKAYWLSGAAALVAAVISIETALAYTQLTREPHAVVIAETTARKGTGERWEPAFTQPLRDGAEFTIVDRSGEWVLGHFEGIGDGWLPKNAIVE
jgi:tetratricopeptide (TPR) repeat protein